MRRKSGARWSGRPISSRNEAGEAAVDRFAVRQLAAGKNRQLTGRPEALERRAKFWRGVGAAAKKSLFDHLVGTCDKARLNVKSDRLRGFLIDDQLEPCRLLNRNIRGTSAAQNLDHHAGSLAVHVRKARTVGCYGAR